MTIPVGATVLTLLATSAGATMLGRVTESRRVLRGARRWIATASGLALVAALMVLTQFRSPPPGSRVRLLIAATRDLPAGARILHEDLRLRVGRVKDGEVLAPSAAAIEGAVTLGPIDRGVPVELTGVAATVRAFPADTFHALIEVHARVGTALSLPIGTHLLFLDDSSRKPAAASPDTGFRLVGMVAPGSDTAAVTLILSVRTSQLATFGPLTHGTWRVAVLGPRRGARRMAAQKTDLRPKT